MGRLENEFIFEEKYKVFFEKLVMIAKEERYQFFLKHPDYDVMILDVMKEFRFASYQKLIKQSNSDYQQYQINTSSGKDYDIANSARFDVDWLVFMEAIKTAIESYSFINNKGEKIPFIVRLKVVYKQCAAREAAENSYENMGQGMTGGTTGKNRLYVNKLVKEVKRLKDVLHDERSYEELVYAVAKGEEDVSIKHNFTRKELEDAIERIEKLDVFARFDSPVNEEGDTLTEIYGLEDKALSKVENMGLYSDFWKSLLVNTREGLERVRVATRKRSMDIIRAILTKDVLIELKLMEIADAEKWEPEPKCRQWCPRRKRCEKSGDGCYVRFSEVKDSVPYGNEEIYHLLSSQEEEIYHKLFHSSYIKSAMESRNLMDVYANRLYPHPAKAKIADKKCFDFSDEFLSKSIGVSKSALAHFRNDIVNEKGSAEDIMRDELKKIFDEVQDR